MANSLLLYIDKWYIVGAIYGNDTIRPLSLPNREDRIWLYFHEDLLRDEISYGKVFQKKYRDNEPHYYGDIFSNITKSSATFTLYQRQQPMREIFRSSKIFDELKSRVESEGVIDTYISFSEDINYASRLIFIEEIEKEDFKVINKSVSLSLLAIMNTIHQRQKVEDGRYLVLTACNENLHYSIFNQLEDQLININSDTLPGRGIDVRNRALIEEVVDTINNNELVLQTNAELEEEYCRMNQFADKWAAKLKTSNSSIPIIISDITLSIDPNKSYSAKLAKNKVIERTKAIIRQIVDVIVTFAKKNCEGKSVSDIILIGDTLTNEQFIKELLGRYSLSIDNVVKYQDADLTTILGSYPTIDHSLFSSLEADFETIAKKQLEEIQTEETDAKIRILEQVDTDARNAREKEAKDKERKFNDAMEKGYEAERNQEYSDMKDYFEIALKYRPEDEEAKQKKEEANIKKAEQEVSQRNYKQKIQQAKSYLESGDYETAKQRAEEALTFMSNSIEAQNIKKEANNRLKSQREFDRYLDRFDMFLAQKLYSEAEEELTKAKLLDLDNNDILNKKEEKLSKAINENIERIDSLKQRLETAIKSNNFDEAINICSGLIGVDNANKEKWTGKLAAITIAKDRALEKDKRWQQLLKDMETAQLANDLKQLVILCKEALTIKKSSEIDSILEKAEAKLKEENEQRHLYDEISKIKDLTLKFEFKEAKKLLKSIRGKIDMEQERELNRLIFINEDKAEKAKIANAVKDSSDNNIPTAKENNKGNLDSSRKSSANADFCGDKESNRKQENSETTKTSKNAKNSDDFFYSNTRPNKSPKDNGKIKKDDFDF